jgi:hypothetical protein
MSSVEPFKADAGTTPRQASAAPAPDAGPGPGNALRAGELQAHVELCKRAAELPLLGRLGVQHHWLRTPGKEVGMGQDAEHLPGHGEPPPVGLSTKWVSHAAEKDKSCAIVQDVDVACVERETELGKDTGPWIPLVNDCHTKTQEVLDRCSTKPRAEPPPDQRDPLRTGAGYSL